ncbi:MAG: pyruvate dehydrogenase (acetyl-transferring) E1 component subunit alpha [Anaerolineae bacterium]|nr:pyruvate dehydrogenase (acetyl-transferring) E1 component subunit alpha [Anaerolineae bacterium]
MERENFLRLFHEMVVIRLMEEKAAELYQQGKIGGFLHLYIGQEAVSTGLISARRPEDRGITAYRDHGVAYNCGVSAKEIIAELLGKATGVSGGKGGSMHLADVTKNYWGGHAIVGAHLPLATGLALADAYNKTPAATICMFGDGATNIGYFHEALNLSKVWKLPVLWVCENNKYGMGTSIERASAVSEIRQKAEGYGMKNDVVDGMDVIKVQEKALQVLDEIRNGSGPQFLEIETYRFRGHSMGDPERYRKQDEVRHWEQENDPIGILQNYLINNNLVSREDLDEQSKLAEQEVNEAVEFAEASPEPAAEELYNHIYVEE